MVCFVRRAVVIVVSKRIFNKKKKTDFINGDIRLFLEICIQINRNRGRRFFNKVPKRELEIFFLRTSLS